ncbi:MAG: hypothetical protein IJ493_05635 [Clostridia bacterium]|nr:hypothetical protein [Clostridia bacterium]
MILSFDQNNRTKTTELLSHHDVVFRAPVCDPSYGLPIGNGNTGCLLWLSDDTLHIQVNHTDLIDGIESGATDCETPQEHIAFCRNGVRVDIQFDCPIFETIYQQGFEARLSLAEAAAHIHGKTAFGSADISAICSEACKTAVVRVNTDFTDALPMTCRMQRWGSRAFMHWYFLFRDHPQMGLEGTASSIEDDCLCVTQQMRGRAFCAALTAVSADEHDAVCVGSHSADLRFTPKKQRDILLYITIGIGDTAEDAKKTALEQLQNALHTGFQAIAEAHLASWEKFWEKSFVSLPEDQDFLENLWYLNLYYANCQMRGSVPAHFCNGIWGSYHDFVPWGGYFHYNGQLATFPLEAADHPELTETYYRFRRAQLPQAMNFAREIKHTSGAFYDDICDMNGVMSTGEKDNCTCGAQIALGMYQHYLYTGDEKFLRETVLPVMREIGRFYLDVLVMAEDGCWHIYKTQGYEGSPLLDDSITDHAMIRALFTTLQKLLPAEEAAVYRERLERLAPFTAVNFDEDELTADGRISHGIGKGKMPPADRVLGVGIKDGKWIRKTRGNPAKDYYGFPDTEMAPLFPAGITGLAERDSELFRMITNSALLHHEVKFGHEMETCMGWCMMPIYLARLGQAELLVNQCEQTISGWIIYPQGFGFYTPMDRQEGYITERFRHYRSRREGTSERGAVPGWNFRHFDYETLPILAASVNEILLQSYDGILRLFPAVRRDTRLAFRLAAAGGYLADAVYDHGSCAVTIECRRGGRLSIAVDNVDEPLKFFDADGSPICVSGTADVYTLETAAGQSIRIVSGNAPSFERAYDRNMEQKTCGDAKLGTQKEF